jgi:type I site-specific restriction-modification system R (restriction) subunit
VERKDGSLAVLRQGFKDISAKFDMCQFKPAQALNPEAQEQYNKVRCRVVRQVRYCLYCENSIDLVFFINGIPVATAELKTDFTQSIEDAKNQYRFDRNPRDPASKREEPLLAFKRRALVHFAVSTDEVWMATELKGTLVAFSGEVNDPENGVVPFTENNMNTGLKGRDLRDAFDSNDFQVLLVANKYQTGFDQPKLVAMYVDKKLSGVAAVQTLSRLNRIRPAHGQDI